MAKKTEEPQQEWEGPRTVSGGDLEEVFEDESVIEDSDERTRRGRKRRHAIVLIFLLLLIIGGVIFAMMIANGTVRFGPAAQAGNEEPPACPVETLDYPQAMDGFLIGIYNGTSRSGLAADVAEQMRQRGFALGVVTNGELRDQNIVAAIISGSSGRSNALAVQAQIPGSDYFQDERVETSVGVILGNQFAGLQDPASVVAEAGTLSCPRFDNGANPADGP